MEKSTKKEKPTPSRCVCGAEPIFVKTRSGKMLSCPNPLGCRGNLRTTWKKSNDLAIIEWNSLVSSFYEKDRKKKKKGVMV